MLKRVSAFGTGLVKQAGLVPGDSNVLLLLNDGLGEAGCQVLIVHVLTGIYRVLDLGFGTKLPFYPFVHLDIQLSAI